jgi:hypothetical protein
MPQVHCAVRDVLAGVAGKLLIEMNSATDNPLVFAATDRDAGEMISDVVVAPESLMRGFFRTPTGPGWALLGDACHFKHPGTAQGIADAVEQAIYIAEALSGAKPTPQRLRGGGTPAPPSTTTGRLPGSRFPQPGVSEKLSRAGQRARGRPGPPRLVQPPVEPSPGDEQDRLARWFETDPARLEVLPSDRDR